MLTIDGKELRNLEEQVEKNKQDILFIINEQGSLNQFGIKVVGQIDILNNLPTVDEYKQSNPEWEYGDAYAVGVTSPYSLYILTRANGTHTEDYWFNIGQFPLQGPKGDAGDSSSVAVGTTTTLIEGSPARVENVGTTRDATLNFYIPRGDKGEKGDAATITLGRVEKGTTAQITNSGDDHNAVFNFTLPQGDKGDKGDAGDSFQIVGELANIGLLPEPSRSIRHEAYIIPDSEGHNHLWGITGPDSGPLLWTDLGQITGIQGQAATISVGTTTTLPAGQSASVSNVGTEQDAVFNFGIPKGADGTAASVQVGTVTTLPAGQMATVQNSGTATNAVLNFGIPKGQDGDGVQPVEIALTPATATQGTLTDEQLSTLQSNKNNWISLNNELYRLNDEQTSSGYLVYSHEGQDSTKLFQLKAITITISTKAWVLMTFTPQSQLTFDTTPTENSLNPVTSAGIFTALQNAGGSKKFADYTWEEIHNISNAIRNLSGLGDDQYSYIELLTGFKVGDTKTLTLTNGDTYPIRIIDFNDSVDENGKANGIRLEFESLYKTQFYMGTSESFITSKMFTETLPSIFDLFPDDIKPYVRKTHIMRYNYKYTEEFTGDTELFLYSVYEIFGQSDNYLQEGSRMLKYWAEHTSDDDRKKYKLGSTLKRWLLSSFLKDFPTTYYAVSFGGALTTEISSDESGVAICFSI
jgi:hypothetical protein